MLLFFGTKQRFACSIWKFSMKSGTSFGRWKLWKIRDSSWFRWFFDGIIPISQLLLIQMVEPTKIIINIHVMYRENVNRIKMIRRIGLNVVTFSNNILKISKHFRLNYAILYVFLLELWAIFKCSILWSIQLYVLRVLNALNRNRNIYRFTDIFFVEWIWTSAWKSIGIETKFTISNQRNFAAQSFYN